MGDRSLQDMQDGSARTPRGRPEVAYRQLAPVGAAAPGTQMSSDDTVAREILASAKSLLDRASVDTRGLWPRAAVLLQRQALEVALKTYWSAKASGGEDCSTRAQFLCLGTYLRDEPVARRAHQSWAALSRAAHFHPYELPPTQEELLAWNDAVSELLDHTERSWTQ